MRRTRTILAALLIALPLVGAGCLDSDVSLVVDFFNSWAQSHGVIDKDGDPTIKTVAYVGSGGRVSTGDDVVDAAIDAGGVANSIRKTDKLVADADGELAKNPPNHEAALKNIDDALDIRPKDSFLRSRKGMVLIGMNQSTAAKPYLTTYSAECNAGNPSQATAQKCIRNIQNEANATAGGDLSCDRLAVRRDAYQRMHDLSYAAKYPENGDDDTAHSMQQQMRDKGCTQ